MYEFTFAEMVRVGEMVSWYSDFPLIFTIRDFILNLKSLYPRLIICCPQLQREILEKLTYFQHLTGVEECCLKPLETKPYVDCYVIYAYVPWMNFESLFHWLISLLSNFCKFIIWISCLIK